MIKKVKKKKVKRVWKYQDPEREKNKFKKRY